jgi:hypothetical protein
VLLAVPLPTEASGAGDGHVGLLYAHSYERGRCYNFQGLRKCGVDMKSEMITRTASLAIDIVSQQDKVTEADGTCYLVDNGVEVYFRWNIQKDNRIFASRAGRYVSKTTETRDERFEKAIRKSLTSIKRFKREDVLFQINSWSFAEKKEPGDILGKIITTLEQVKLRPFMYIYPDAEAAISFLIGFNSGCSAAGFGIYHYPKTPYEAIIEARGWPFYAKRPVEEMRLAGMSEEEVIKELVEIDLLSWKATYFVE